MKRAGANRPPTWPEDWQIAVKTIFAIISSSRCVRKSPAKASGGCREPSTSCKTRFTFSKPLYRTSLTLPPTETTTTISAARMGKIDFGKPRFSKTAKNRCAACRIYRRAAAATPQRRPSDIKTGSSQRLRVGTQPKNSRSTAGLEPKPSCEMVAASTAANSCMGGPFARASSGPQFDWMDSKAKKRPATGALKPAAIPLAQPAARRFCRSARSVSAVSALW
mmetsp:Transcript_55574/g.129597  ORF Transcript_55574/g.129597 Transcript_55574/m.129597 type:complete len:222 (+) Transcript_55574:2-667(+)